MLDELPVPIYTTDAEGAVTYWNRACVDFAGRVPELGQDRWCVTWQLFTTAGEPLPHEDCPMAQAIKEQRPIREPSRLPSGPTAAGRLQALSHSLVRPAGALTGAVNMLIDVTDEQSEALHEQAERCRRLAEATYDRETSKVLGDMAEGFDKIAEDLSPKRRLVAPSVRS